jgi:hypothetical protein
MSNIFEYINNYGCSCDINLINEINNIFNNIDESNCYIEDTLTASIKINGAAGVLNEVGVYELVYIIPNIFRKCFYSKQIKLPEACPSYTSSNNYIQNLPLIINKNIIKSLLYFNFPSNYKNYNIYSQINQISKLKNILIKKKNTTYGSYSFTFNIINEIYSQDSILLQLINLNRYLLECDIYYTNGKTSNSFTVIWNILISCLSYNETNIYTIGSSINSSNLIRKILVINNQQGVLINKIRNTNLLSDSYTSLRSIFNILNYANEVYEEISLSIKYFMTNGVFCKQNYMSLKNLKPLLKLYNRYYKNQQYINDKSLVLNDISYIIPSIITINEYINKFKDIFLETYPNTTYLKNVILFITNGLVFFNNNIIENDYYYYYINTLNPSPQNLTNSWILTIDYSTSGIGTFINNFIYGVDSYPGFLSTSGATNYKYESYSGGGLYPDKGLDYTNNNNIGYKYLFYNSKELLLYTVYLTLRTINTSEAYGVSLII